MALNGLYCADVPLSNYSVLSHSLTHFAFASVAHLSVLILNGIKVELM